MPNAGQDDCRDRTSMNRCQTPPRTGRSGGLFLPFCRFLTSSLGVLAVLALGGCGGDRDAPDRTPAPDPARALHAGVAVGELDLPVGVPQSGYGARYAKIPLLALGLGGGGIRPPDDRE